MFGVEEEVDLEDVEVGEITEAKSIRNTRVPPSTQITEFLLRK